MFSEVKVWRPGPRTSYPLPDLKKTADWDSLPALGQALTLTPTLVTVWTGFTEILTPAQRGTAQLTVTPGMFMDHYRAVLDTLRADSRIRIVTANLPRLSVFPFFSTLPWFVVDSDGTPIPHPVTGERVPLLGEEGSRPSDLQPPPDGTYDAVMRARDAVGQWTAVTGTLTIENGGVPRVYIVNGDVEWPIDNPEYSLRWARRSGLH